MQNKILSLSTPPRPKISRLLALFRVLAVYSFLGGNIISARAHEIVISHFDGWDTYDAETGAFLRRVDTLSGNGGGAFYYSPDQIYAVTGSHLHELRLYVRSGEKWSLEKSFRDGNFNLYQAPIDAILGPNNTIYVVYQNSHTVLRWLPGLPGSNHDCPANNPDSPEDYGCPDAVMPSSSARRFPVSAALHPTTGILYVLLYSGQVWRLKNGAPVDAGPIVNPGAGHLTKGMALDRNGLLYVVDPSVRKVMRYDSETGKPFGVGGNTIDATFVHVTDGTVNGMGRVAIGPDGNLYLGISTPNFETGGVWRYRGTDGSPFGRAGSTTNALFIVSIGGADDIAFSEVSAPVARIGPHKDLIYETSSPLRTGTPWIFTIGQPSIVSGLALRVQSTLTPNVESTWLDMGLMHRLYSTWSFTTSELPTGIRYFRVIASAPTYPDQLSSVLGPLTVGAALPSVTISKTTGKYTLASLPESPNPNFVEVKVPPANSVEYFIDSVQNFFKNALAIFAEATATARMTVAENQTLTIPAVNIGANSTFILAGTVNGAVSLISSSVLSENGLGLVSDNGGAVLSRNETSLGKNQSSGSLQQTTAALIGQDGAGLIGQDGAGLIGQDGAGFTRLNLSSRENIMIQRVQAAAATPSFTGVMTVNGDYRQAPGTALSIAITGTNTVDSGRQEYDQLAASGRADLAGVIAFGLFNPSDPTILTDRFQPREGTMFDVVVANTIVFGKLIVRGPIWADGLHFKWSVVQRADGKQALRLVSTRVAPPLVIQSAGTQVEVVYPTNYIGFALQTSVDPGSGNWTTISTGASRVNLDQTGPARFFRLFKQ